MRVPFHQGVPVPLRDRLEAYDVTTAHELGWSELANGKLLDRADREGFEVFVTTDSSLRYQQRLDDRCFALVVLRSTSWPRIAQATASIRTAIDSASPGSVQEVDIP